MENIILELDYYRVPIAGLELTQPTSCLLHAQRVLKVNGIIIKECQRVMIVRKVNMVYGKECRIIVVVCAEEEDTAMY
jgi:hypothetical protein